MTVLPCFNKTGKLVLSLRTENDQPVVKNHGRTDFVETSMKRSRRTHRSIVTEPISTEPLLGKTKREKVMVTSDIGLQNVKNHYLNKKINNG